MSEEKDTDIMMVSISKFFEVKFKICVQITFILLRAYNAVIQNYL
jgi:hypothetical protein